MTLNKDIHPNPHITQEIRGKKGRVSAFGKDKRYPERYGKHYYSILFIYQDGSKTLFTFDYQGKLIK